MLEVRLQAKAGAKNSRMVTERKRETNTLGQVERLQREDCESAKDLVNRDKYETPTIMMRKNFFKLKLFFN